MRNEGSFRSWCLGLLYLSCLSSLLSAQVEVGSLFGAVEDTEGIALPGVTLSLTGYGELKVQTSDALGQFRFLGLEPGVWSLEAKLDSFATVDYSTITIEASRSTTIVIELTTAIEEVITVVAENPLLDERKLATGTSLRQVDLEKLPMARDPWAAATQSAGVVVNRIDVGGASGAQQANLSGIAVGFTQNDYVLDGAQITDPGGKGLIAQTSTYFDFDQFEELQILTGGNDITKNTPGIAVSLVTKRGSNEMRGSARFLLTEGDGYFGVLKQAEPGFDEADLGPGQEDFVGDEIDRLTDFGFEAGGPAWRDHLWLWGAWGKRDFNVRAGNAAPKLTVLENAAIKVNAQLSTANSLVASYNNGDKRQDGQGAGPGVDRSATRNQRSPAGITKVEDSHVFGSNLFLTATYNYVDSGFDATAVGGAGPDRPPIPDPGGEVNRDATGYLTNNSSIRHSRPQEAFKIDASYFLNTGTVAHELRFGGQLRQTHVQGTFSYPGRGLFHYHGSLAGLHDPDIAPIVAGVFGVSPDRATDIHLVYAYRGGEAPSEVDTRSVWVQDTLTWSRWTVNAGLRFDSQDGANLPDTVEANIGFPEVIPAIEYPGDDAGGFSWKTLAPRLGVTYALGETRQTLLRASLSQFPSPLSHNEIERTNPISGQLATILFLDDSGGFSGFYDDGEDFVVVGGLFGFDPNNPTALSTSNRTDPELDTEVLTELVIAAEHAFLPEFVTGLSLTWRRNDNRRENQPLFQEVASGEIRTASRNDYLFDGAVSGELPDGTPYEWDTFALQPNLRSTGGSYLTNGDRRLEAMSAALTLTKRLSNRWMARGFINYIFKEDWSVPESYFDHNDPNRTGAAVIDGSPIEGLNSRWQWNLNGMYQVAPERGWGFNVAANLTGRQGLPLTYTRGVFGTDGIGRGIIVVDSVDDYRLEDIFVADLRLEKEFAASGDTSLTFSIDAFNIFNQGYVTDRVTNLNSGRVDWVIGTLPPRVYRLGVRLNWR